MIRDDIQDFLNLFGCERRINAEQSSGVCHGDFKCAGRIGGCRHSRIFTRVGGENE